MFRKSNKYSKLGVLKLCSELKEEHLKPSTSTWSRKALSHHRSLWASTTNNVQKGTILFNQISFWANSKKGTFQEHNPFEHIPKRAHSNFIIFHFEHIPNQAYSKNGTFQNGHIPEQFSSLQPLVQANAGSSKSKRRGAAAAADKSISSYPRSQSSRVPMRSAEGWSQLLFDRCGLQSYRRKPKGGSLVWDLCTVFQWENLHFTEFKLKLIIKIFIWLLSTLLADYCQFSLWLRLVACKMLS